MEISKRIKMYRTFLGLTQEEMADRAGINDKYYGRIERGESNPTFDYVVKICDAMEIDVIELLLCEEKTNPRRFRRNPNITKGIIDGLKEGVDIHFNRDILYDDCEQVIWYNGYIGSMSFDEFEFQVYAIGNVKGQLYIEGKCVLEINTAYAANELKKYINNDKELKELIEYMSYNDEVLEEKNGNVFFVTETNWLSGRIINNSTGEVIAEDLFLEKDNIVDGLSDKAVLFDYIF